MHTLNNDKVFTFPIFCLVLYLIAEYARIALLGPLQLALVAQLFLAIYFFRSSNQIKEVIRDRYFKYYFILLTIMVFHIFFARNNYWAFMQFRLMITYLIITLSCCLYIDTEKKFYFIISVFVFIHLLAALNWLLGMSFIGRSGPLGDENDFALAMNVVTPVCFFLGLAHRGVKRLYFWGSAVILIIGNVVTASRGGFVGLACVAAFCIPFLKAKFKALLILCLAAVVFWFSIPDTYKDRIYSIKAETSEETGGSGYGRTQVWDLAWHVFLHHPLLGVGQGGINYYLGEYVDESSSAEYWAKRRGQNGRAAHSVYFTLLPELGLIGGTLFILMLKSNIDKIREIRAHAQIDHGLIKYICIGLVVGLVGYLTSGIFLSAFYYPQFWNISAFVLSAYSILKKQDSEMSIIQS